MSPNQLCIPYFTICESINYTRVFFWFSLSQVLLQPAHVIISHIWSIFTARKRSLRMLCFYTCLSVILFTGGLLKCMMGCTPLPPPSCQRQASPRGPEADTPQGQGADTPTPTQTQRQVPPWEQCMLGDTGNKRAVRILLECILVMYVFPVQ